VRQIRAVNLGVRFALELAALGVLALWGWRHGLFLPGRLLLAVLLPGLAAAVWGAFVAPRARRHLPRPGRLVVEAAFFGVAALALADLASAMAGWSFAAAAAVNAGLVHLWDQDGRMRTAVLAEDRS
jgi:hypothetical protein